MLIPYVISFIILVSMAMIRGEQISQPANWMWGGLAGILVMEHMARLQVIGVAVAVAAIALITI